MAPPTVEKAEVGIQTEPTAVVTQEEKPKSEELHKLSATLKHVNSFRPLSDLTATKAHE